MQEERFGGGNTGNPENSRISSSNARHFGIEDERDGWISSHKRANKPSLFRVPNNLSHSAKKLAKPYSILMPPLLATTSENPLWEQGINMTDYSFELNVYYAYVLQF